MAKHIVKCAICGESFDTNSIQATRHGARRYAHQSCYPQGELVPLDISSKEDPELTALKSYIKNLFGEQCNWASTMKYIKNFKEENGYSYSGMLKSLVYFYEVKNNSIDKANGSIGIIPFVYQDAYNYYYALFMAQQNIEKTGSDFKYIEKERIIDIPKSKGVLKKLFNIEVKDEE